jgi:hypothetical protein
LVKKKKKIILIVLVGLSIIFFQTHHVSASSYIYSVRLQSDVVFSNGLTSYNDASNYLLESEEEKFDAKELFIKNTETHIYIAIRVENQDFFQEEGLAVLFDSNHDGLFAEDVKILDKDQTLKDGYFYGNSDFSEQGNTETTGSVSLFPYIDGSQQRLYEFKIPFQTDFPTKDISVYDPDNFLLGFEIALIFPNEVISWNNGNQTALIPNASNYQTIILAGPGRYAIPNFEPEVITSSVSSSSSKSTSTTTQIGDGKETFYSDEAGAASGFEIITVGLSFLIISGLIKKQRRRKD